MSREFVEFRGARVAASPQAVFAAVERSAGGVGLPLFAGLWRLRARLGGLAPTAPAWEVESRIPPWRLRLRTLIPLPGEATLEYFVTPVAGGSRIQQVCRFRADGLRGELYWKAVLPLHGLVFDAMLAGVCRLAEGAAPREAAA